MICRGEIWWADLPPPQGSEPGYRRPLVIVSSDHFNKSQIGTVVGVIVTSNLTFAAASGNVRLSPRQSRLSKPSVVNVSQVVTVDKRALLERVGRIPAKKFAEIEAGLRTFLSL